MKAYQDSLVREVGGASGPSVKGAVTFSTTSAAEPDTNPETTTTVEADHPEPGPPRPKRRPRSNRSLGRKARLLVADNSPGVREWLAGLFEEEGYEVILASDGQEALDKYAPGLIDLVLLDLDLPIRSGWDVFEEIVALNGSQAIILLTEQAGAVNLAGSGRAAGVAEKPLKPGVLLDAVRSALEEPPAAHHYTVEVQHSFARYTRPYNGAWSSVESYEHWGLND